MSLDMQRHLVYPAPVVTPSRRPSPAIARTLLALVATAALLVLVPDPVSAATGQDPSDATPSGRGVATDSTSGPARVHARVRLVQRELDILRREMGRPAASPLDVRIRDASPREVNFQAVTLLRKVDRLTFQVMRERGGVPEPMAEGVTPSDVLAVVDSALARLRRVKRHLGIRRRPAAVDVDPDRTPDDVFRAIIRANRQINQLLDHQFTPSEVFQQVTRAIAYAGVLLRDYRDVTIIPEAPPLRPGKSPPDVYRRLLDCVEASRGIAARLGMEVLELELGPGQLRRVEPSDVYDVATLLVAELAYIHARFDAGERVRSSYYPGERTPSDVFQRVGILDRQLRDLDRLTRERGPPGDRSGTFR